MPHVGRRDAEAKTHALCHSGSVGGRWGRRYRSSSGIGLGLRQPTTAIERAGNEHAHSGSGDAGKGHRPPDEPITGHRAARDRRPRRTCPVFQLEVGHTAFAERHRRGRRGRCDGILNGENIDFIDRLRAGEIDAEPLRERRARCGPGAGPPLPAVSIAVRGFAGWMPHVRRRGRRGHAPIGR